MCKSIGCQLGALVLVLIGLPLLFVALYQQQPGVQTKGLVVERSEQFRPANDLKIGVVGTKFHWKFRYPGSDGLLGTADDVISERALHLPPNANVTFHITSEDYIYIFGIPKNENSSHLVESREPEKIREIAVPSLTHFIEHRFTENGTYDLMVDPLCGFQSIHDPLMGQIFVSPDHDFETLFPGVQQNSKPSPSHGKQTL